MYSSVPFSNCLTRFANVAPVLFLAAWSLGIGLTASAAAQTPPFDQVCSAGGHTGDHSGWGAAAQTPTFVQVCSGQITSGTANSLTFRSANTAGNLIVVYAIWNNTGTASVSDSRGNVYQSAVGPTAWSNYYQAQVFYAKNIEAGANTVTVRFSAAITSFGISYIHEYSGIDRTAPLDVVAAATGTSRAMSSGWVAVTNANDLLFGAAVSSNVATKEGIYYRARSTAYGNLTEDRVITRIGWYSATGTQNGNAWAMQMVAFKAAGSTPHDTQPPSVPTDLSATAVSANQVNLSWTASTDNVGVAGYKVFRGGSQIATVTSGTSYQDTGLSPATAYSYTIDAYDAAGHTSAQSLPLDITTLASGTYTTSFPLTENPIAEGGNWINGETVGLDWSNVATTPGLAIGLQAGTGGYADAVALLTGTWTPDQSAQATIYTTNRQSGNIFEEVELRLRSSLSAHDCTGYEINVGLNTNAYMQIVRWNGALGDFTILDARSITVESGDIVTATIVGNVITAYINEVQVLQVSDSTYSSGNPGMGFFLDGAIGVNSDYGFTSFTASNGALSPP